MFSIKLDFLIIVRQLDLSETETYIQFACHMIKRYLSKYSFQNLYLILTSSAAIKSKLNTTKQIKFSWMILHLTQLPIWVGKLDNVKKIRILKVFKNRVMMDSRIQENYF